MKTPRPKHFQWFPALTAALLVSGPVAAQDVSFNVGFDSPGLESLPEGVTISTQFDSPDQVPGVVGSAWRTDGFSSWADVEFDLDGSEGFAVAMWVALESFPSDLEVPVDRLSPSSIVHQRNRSRGFDLFIDTYGRWGLWLGISGRDVTLDAPDQFPLYRWVHVVVTASAGDEAALFVDGTQIAAVDLRRNSEIEFAATALELARSPSEVGFLNFTFNRLNGAYDELKVYERALSADEVQALYDGYSGEIPDAMDSLIVPDSRFANDHLRPRLHAMPPANWTNEPHGMVRFNGAWHLFYQRTPNGPYKTQMHWGHMVSDDLVTWRHLPDALRPELQTDDFGFDQKGIWSGDVIVDGDTAFAFYTSVNHFHRLTASNPGVAMAVSEDPNLETWRKIGPIANTEHVLDFRDPYLFRDGETWHMIIGASLETGGGLDYWVLDTSDGQWKHRDRFSAVSYRLLDYGSDIWEMPVFEPMNEDVHVLVVNPIGGRVSKYGDPATRGVYWMGEWRDGLFHPFENEPRVLDILPGHLSPTVALGDDGLLRAIGIVDERRTPQSQEDAGWAHTFSFPRSWYLMPDERTLGQAPAPELRALRGGPVLDTGSNIIDGTVLPLVDGHQAYEIEINVEDGDSTIVLDLLMSPDGEEFTRLTFDPVSGDVVLDKSESSQSGEDEGPPIVSGNYDSAAFGPIRTLRVYVDGSIVDVFVNDAAAFGFRSYPARADSNRAALSAAGGPLEVASAKVWPLRLAE